MATLHLSSGMTPIRVRGKRTATKAEKWHAGKQRRRTLYGNLSLASPVAREVSVGTAPRIAKRRKVHLSRLEQLPSEMIQAIFVYSENLDLPLSSPALALQLSGKQLQWELTVNALSRIVHCTNDRKATTFEMAHARRLLNSRFMTWPLFSNWLLRDAEEHGVSTNASDAAESHPEEGEDESSRYSDIWLRLRPSVGFAPPTKLLHGPWTEERISFLKVFSLKPGGCTVPLDGVAGEVAYEGLIDAVQETSLEAIEMLRCLRIQPDQDLLRKAVVDFGCSRDVVLYLLQWCVTEIMRWSAGPVNREAFYPRLQINFLDPVIWAWAEKARATGDSTGEWLTKTMKRVSSVIASDDTHGEIMEDGSPYSYR